MGPWCLRKSRPVAPVSGLPARGVLWTALSLALALGIGVFVPTSGQAFGVVSELWGYLKQYQFGVDYARTQDSLIASYDQQGAGGSGCVDSEGRPGYRTCSVAIATGASSGYGFVLQQAFKRQGTFYFRPDLSFGIRYLSGSLSEGEAKKQGASSLPLKSLDYSLAAVVVKPFVQLGITPQSRWPDILLSLGPAMQVALGQVAVNEQKEAVVMATTSDSYFFGFFELELVFARFGDGAFSVFTSTDNTSGDRRTKFYPKTVDGMDRFFASSARSISGDFWGFGLKLILDWP